MIHLTATDYRRMPWANGRGMTVEIMRVDTPDGGLLWRLSMASVVEDGSFSIFPGIERNLTVLSGPGFRLEGQGVALECRPLVPVAFAGDVAVSAVGTGGQVSEDFNVMTARSIPVPEVRVMSGGRVRPEGGTACIFALGMVHAGGVALMRHDLLTTRRDAVLEGPAIVVRGLP